MNKYIIKENIVALTVGLLVALFIGFITIPNIAINGNSAKNNVSNMHTHADYSMVIEGVKIDFKDDRYQSKKSTALVPDIHLHDNKGNIIHRHTEGVTIGSMIDSLGFKYTTDCLTTDLGSAYCAVGEKSVQLYVNSKLEPVGPDYVTQDLDKILIFFGRPADAEKYFNQVTDDACIYSGSCPERGTPPSENEV